MHTCIHTCDRCNDDYNNNYYLLCFLKQIIIIILVYEHTLLCNYVFYSRVILAMFSFVYNRKLPTIFFLSVFIFNYLKKLRNYLVRLPIRCILNINVVFKHHRRRSTVCTYSNGTLP